MGELLRKILNIAAWIALIIGIILLLLKIFGNNPTELQVITPFLIFGIAKVWEINNNLKDFKHEIRISFKKVRNDINNLHNKFNKK